MESLFQDININCSQYKKEKLCGSAFEFCKWENKVCKKKEPSEQYSWSNEPHLVNSIENINY